MAAYIARRLLLAFFTVWVISVAAFVIIELPPGDTIDRMFDRTTRTHGEAVAIEMLEALRLRLGLDEPKHVRYGKWMWALLQGDLGQTMVPYGGLGNQRAVKEVIGDRLFTTIALTGFTVLVTWTFAIPVGIYSAVRQHSVGDYIFTFVGFSGLAVPDFLLGLVMMYIAFAYFDQSVGGLFSADYAGTSWLDGGVNWGKVFDLINHLWVPAIVLGTSGTAGLIRVMRNNLLDELGQALRSHRTGQGGRVVAPHPQVPGPGRHKPDGQHRGLPAAVPRGRERHRVGRVEPADPRTSAARRHPARGHVYGRPHHPYARDAHRRGHTDLGRAPGRR